MVNRFKILLFFPFVILYFLLIVILGKEKTDIIGNWIIENI